MRQQHFRTGPAWRTNLAPVPELTVEGDTPDLTRTQKMALLEVRSAGADSLHGKVLHYLRAVGSDEPSCYDLTKLREWGYIIWKRAGRDWGCDVLTPGGLHKAEMIAREIARDCGVHHITIRPPGKRANGGAIATCSCGAWSDHKTRSQIGALDRSAAAHLAAVAAGTWVKPRPVEAFLSEIAPPQFNFTSGSAKPPALPAVAEPDHGAGGVNPPFPARAGLF